MKLTLIAACAALLACPALAHDGVHIIDPYARVIGPSGAVYFRIGNDEAVDDTLVSATSPDAGMVMLMTSGAGSDGVMKMASVPDGFSVPANDERAFTGAGGLRRQLRLFLCGERCARVSRLSCVECVIAYGNSGIHFTIFVCLF